MTDPVIPSLVFGALIGVVVSEVRHRMKKSDAIWKARMVSAKHNKQLIDILRLTRELQQGVEKLSREVSKGILDHD